MTSVPANLLLKYTISHTTFSLTQGACVRKLTSNHSISRKNKDYEHYQSFARDWLDQRGLLDELGIPKKVP